MPSVTLPVTGYDTSDYKVYQFNSSYPMSNIYNKTAAKGNSYSGIALTRNSNAETYVYLTFDISSIPTNVTIKSITANVKIYGSSTVQSRTQKREIQLYSGTTAKGTAQSFSCNGGASIFSIDNGGSWTRSELDNLRLRVYAQRNTSSPTTNVIMYLMGADITIEYEEGGSGGGDQPSTPATFTVSENLGTYQGKTSYISDGSTSSGTWRADKSASSGYYVQWAFDKNVILTGFNYQSSQSSEIFHTGCYLQVSEDGSSWTDVGQFTGRSPCNFTDLNTECRYVRIYSKSGSGYVSITEAMPIWNEITIVKNRFFMKLSGKAVAITKIFKLSNGQLVSVKPEELDRNLKYVRKK